MKFAALMLCALCLSSGAVAEVQAWPPALESLRDGNACTQPPSCDPNAAVDEGSAAFVNSDRFVRVLSTTESDCASLVAVTDPRARVGNIVAEPLGIQLKGSCILNKEGSVIGAVHEGILASCQQTPQAFGSVALETAIVKLALLGEGKAQVPVFGLPWLLVGQSSCEIALDVRIEERAATPPKASAQ